MTDHRTEGERPAPRGPLRKVAATRASDVCKNFELPPEARPLLRETSTPRDFLEALLAAKQYKAAVSFLAHAVPPREAVWWGCLCLQHASAAPLPPPGAAALKAAVRWVLEPSEENRSAAKPPAEAAGMGTAAGALGMAAAWTGGSLAPPNPKVPPVAPGPFMPAKAVAGAVLLAAAKADPVRIADTQRLFVELGLGVAEGRFVWPDVKPEPTGTWSRPS